MGGRSRRAGRAAAPVFARERLGRSLALPKPKSKIDKALCAAKYRSKIFCRNFSAPRMLQQTEKIFDRDLSARCYTRARKEFRGIWRLQTPPGRHRVLNTAVAEVLS